MPEARSGFRHPDLISHCRDNRSALLVAALTVLRAGILTKPDAELAPLGSFESWSRVIRGTLVWLGQADPYRGERLEDGDPERESLGGLLAALREAQLGQWMTSFEIVALARQKKFPELQTRFSELCDRGEINSRTVGYVFRRAKGKILGGLVLESQKGARKATRWKALVVPATENSREFGV